MGVEHVKRSCQLTASDTQMVCSGHSDKGVQMKTFDERVPDSVSGWIVNCIWSSWHRTVPSVFTVSLLVFVLTSNVSVTHIHNSVFHLINFFIHYCWVECYFSNVSKQRNKSMENKGECLLLKTVFHVVFVSWRKSRGLPTWHQERNVEKHDIFPLDHCLL